MNILFDLISTQGSINGGAEYTKRVFFELLKYRDVYKYNVFCIWDSKQRVVYEELKPNYLEYEYGICCIDLNVINLKDIVFQFRINRFFIGIAQRWINKLNQKINCKIIIVFHDLVDIEIKNNNLDNLFCKLNFKTLLSNKIKHIKFVLKGNKNVDYLNLLDNLKINNVEIITVSNYSKCAFEFYFSDYNYNVQVLYSPLRLTRQSLNIENDLLKQVIDSQIKYFLILSCDRKYKNSRFAIEVFKKFSKNFPDYYLVTIGEKVKFFENQIILPYLNESDLDNAIINSFALLYPTIYEGFGYPPIEALRHDVPVICSNVCSIPEILGDSVIYFSPFYRADLYRALKHIIAEREIYVKNLETKFNEICEIQEKALKELINIITN